MFWLNYWKLSKLRKFNIYLKVFCGQQTNCNTYPNFPHIAKNLERREGDQGKKERKRERKKKEREREIRATKTKQKLFASRWW